MERYRLSEKDRPGREGVGVALRAREQRECMELCLQVDEELGLKRTRLGLKREQARSKETPQSLTQSCSNFQYYNLSRVSQHFDFRKF